GWLWRWSKWTLCAPSCRWDRLLRPQPLYERAGPGSTREQNFLDSALGAGGRLLSRWEFRSGSATVDAHVGAGGSDRAAGDPGRHPGRDDLCGSAADAVVRLRVRPD